MSGVMGTTAVVMAWIAAAFLLAVVATQVLSISGNAALALIQDSSPMVLSLAWPIIAVAALRRHWLLLVVALGLAVYQIATVAPRARRERLPPWTTGAARLTVAVANVYIDNVTPGIMAENLVSSGADVVVIVESNPVFIDAFDVLGGAISHPFRLFDPGDVSDYAVCIASRIPLLAGSAMIRIGPLRAARALVTVGSEVLEIIGVNPTAVVDEGGFACWREQIEALTRFVPTVSSPLLIAGDLNGTQDRPLIRRLMASGLVEAHDSLGLGLRPSFKLGASGFLGLFGPLVRLDHALMNTDVRALAARQLPSAGSDHVPFVADLAVAVARVNITSDHA